MSCSPTNEGIQAAAIIRAEHPSIGVVVLSQYVEPTYSLQLFEGGSDGLAYLLKERVADLDEVSTAIRRVASGGSAVDPRVVDALIETKSKRHPSVLERLSEREKELAEMAAGGSNAAIGEALFISPRSVAKHINAIFTKLDLPATDETHRRVRAVVMYPLLLLRLHYVHRHHRHHDAARRQGLIFRPPATFSRHSVPDPHWMWVGDGISAKCFSGRLRP